MISNISILRGDLIALTTDADAIDGGFDATSGTV